MINTNAVVQQVQQGHYPSNWRVYRGTVDYTPAVIFWIGIPFSIIAGGGCIGLWSSFYWFLLILIGSSLLIGCIIKWTADGNRKSLFVFLPDGIVQWEHGKPYAAAWLHFPNIRKIQLASQTTVTGYNGNISTTINHWLDVYGCDGTYMQWQISSCFGDKESLGKSIIAAYEHYWYNNP